MPIRPWIAATIFLSVPAILPAQGSIKLPVPLAELQKRVQTDSNDAYAHYNVALGYWDAKKWDDVERELKTAVALTPRFAQAHLALAYLQFARHPRFWDDVRDGGKQTPKALVDIYDQYAHEDRHAFLIDPMVDMAIIAATSRAVDEVEAREVFGPTFSDYLAGITACEEARYTDCELQMTRVTNEVNRLEDGTRTAPDEVYWYRGIAAAHNKHFDIAAADFKLMVDHEAIRVKKATEKAILRAPLRGNEYRYFEAVFEQAGGHSTDAIALYHTALENDLSLYIAHVRLAEIFEAQHDFPHAIEERQRAVNANPDDPSLQMDLGVTLGKAGKFAEAETALTAATHGLPRDAESWFWLGIAREQLGKKAEAKAAYQKVVELAPSRMAARVAAAKQKIAALS